MKSFKQFITEENLASKSAKEIAELIFADCQFFLKESHFFAGASKYSIGHIAPILLRGLSGKIAGEGILKLNSRKRQPSHSQIEIHEILDDYLNDTFGFRFRSEGTFVTGSKVTATSYGTPFAVFPIGNFKYAWSKKIVDAFTYFDFTIDGLEDIKEVTGFQQNGGIDPETEEWHNTVAEFLEIAHPYESTSLDIAIKKYAKNEIMLGCSSYYAIKDDEMLEDILEELYSLQTKDKNENI